MQPSDGPLSRRRECGHAPEPWSGAYGHWRCQRRRFHLGRHRFNNYTIRRGARFYGGVRYALAWAVAPSLLPAGPVRGLLPAAIPPLRAPIAAYLASKSNRITAATKRSYTSKLRALERFYPALALEAFEPLLIEDFLTATVRSAMAGVLGLDEDLHRRAKSTSQEHIR